MNHCNVLALPTEITAEIFVECLALFEPLCLPPSLQSAPTALSCVCSQWRAIALSTSALWSQLTMECGKFAPKIISEADLVENTVDTWLKRAGPRPISLAVEYSSEGPEIYPFSRLRGIIHCWSHQIQHLRLNLGESRYVDILELEKPSFPLLRTVALGCAQRRRGFTPPVKPVLFDKAPNLTYLRFLDGGVTPTLFALPWSQLTECEGALWDSQLFSLAPALIKLTCSLHAGMDYPSDFIVHHELRSLNLYIHEPVLHIVILPFLTLPELRHLDISAVDGYLYRPLGPFLIRSSPPLQSLTLMGNEFCLALWPQFIVSIANTLEYLEIVESDGEASRFLSPDLFSPLTRIQSLTFRDVSILSVMQLELMVDFLDALANKPRIFKMSWKVPALLYGTMDFGAVGDDLARLRAGMDIQLSRCEETVTPM
ncbi:hypothetical protein R3P38DRAFT_2678356 [Favolaschia claudopus]|uniref:F-box domain-containing protein n=1 Tax=Favolaschia claudopus TaxID=2862362 RepID=A0AAW0ECY5_9AGAR